MRVNMRTKHQQEGKSSNQRWKTTSNSKTRAQDWGNLLILQESRIQPSTCHHCSWNKIDIFKRGFDWIYCWANELICWSISSDGYSCAKLTSKWLEACYKSKDSRLHSVALTDGYQLETCNNRSLEQVPENNKRFLSFKNS